MTSEVKKKKISVKQYIDPLTGKMKKDIFIDDALFPWEVDLNSLEKAKQMGAQYYLFAQMDIQKHFLDSLSDFLGRAISEEEFFTGLKDGWL